MQLLMLNGSPKKANTNTGVMINHFIKGMNTSQKSCIKTEVIEMSHTGQSDIIEKIMTSDAVIIAFPLYGYAMPAQLHELILTLQDRLDKEDKKITFGFIIQYGFLEAIHARPIEKYLRSFTEWVGADYMGTVIKGGCDNLYTQQNQKQSQVILDGIEGIGAVYGKKRILDQRLISDFAQPEIQKEKSKFLMKIFIWAANRFYWKKKYTANGITEEESFAMPYA